MVKSRRRTYQRIPRQLSTKWAKLNNGNNKQDQEKTVPGRLIRQLCKEQLLHAAPAGQRGETRAENAFENATAEPSPDAEKHKRSQTHVNPKEMKSKHLVTQPNQPAGTETLREWF